MCFVLIEKTSFSTGPLIYPFKTAKSRLWRNAQKSLTLFLGSGALRLHPRRVGIPDVEIGSQKVSEKPLVKREE